jgi:hypothetical protein
MYVGPAPGGSAQVTVPPLTRDEAAAGVEATVAANPKASMQADPATPTHFRTAPLAPI